MKSRFLLISSVGVLLSLAFAPVLAESSTLAKLGLPQDSRVLIIHADDVGMSWAADKASVEAMEKGSVTCGSAMVPCPWFLSTINACKENPKLDMGVHLTLTSEWKLFRWGPISDRGLVPKLVDEQGYLWHEVPQVYQSVGGEINQIGIEIQAQIDFAKKLGLEPTHIDSHMGTLYYREDFFKVTCNAALKNDIPFMVFAYREDFAKAYDEIRYYTQETANKLEAAGFPLIDTLIMDEKVGKTVEEGFKNYCDVVSNLTPGVTLLIVHLGMDGEELSHICGSHARRDQQFRIFTDPRMAEHIQKEGVQLMGWRDLKEKIWDKRDKSIQLVF
jgi:chitin disaccharide deacetylase